MRRLLALAVGRLAAPRLQVPLAITACFVALASVYLHVLEIGDLSRGAVRVGVAFAGTVSLWGVHRLFAKAQNARGVYLGALFVPPAIAVAAGVLVLWWLCSTRVMLRLSFAGMLLGESFLERLLPTMVLSLLLGLPGSALLAFEVWLATKAREADKARGAHRFAALAWAIAMTMALASLAVLTGEERLPSLAVLAVGALKLALQTLDARLVRAARTPEAGPYRSMA